MAEAYQTLYNIVLPVIGLCMLACLVRAIIGPRIADRVIAINMLGSMTLIVLCILVLVMDEGYLTDVALVYALLSFLAVVLLAKIYIGVSIGRRNKKQEANEHEHS